MSISAAEDMESEFESQALWINKNSQDKAGTMSQLTHDSIDKCNWLKTVPRIIIWAELKDAGLLLSRYMKPRKPLSVG